MAAAATEAAVVVVEVVVVAVKRFVFRRDVEIVQSAPGKLFKLDTSVEARAITGARTAAPPA